MIEMGTWGRIHKVDWRDKMLMVDSFEGEGQREEEEEEFSVRTLDYWNHMQIQDSYS